MKDYSYWEIGMLIGAALGGICAVAGFTVTGSKACFILAGVGIMAGVAVGTIIDKRTKVQGIEGDKK